MNLYTLFSGLGGASGAATSTSSAGGTSMIFFLIIAFGFMYLTMIRPQKKKQKEDQALRDNIQVGDEITTVGGIVGRVVTVKDDSLIIETGADRNKMKIVRWAVSANNTANEKLEAEREAAKEAQEAEKQARMEESRERSTSKRKKSKKNRNDDMDYLDK